MDSNDSSAHHPEIPPELKVDLQKLASGRMPTSCQLLHLAAALQCSARAFSLVAREGRVYKLAASQDDGVEGRMGFLIGRTHKHQDHVLQAYIGCWYTELGGPNEMNFLWEFGSRTWTDRIVTLKFSK